MQSPISKISNLKFGLLSADEIRNESVVKIDKQELYNGSVPVENGLFDRKMGTIDANDICDTDLLPNMNSPGYFGHIELNLPIFSHNNINTILQTLSVICIKCGNLIHPLYGDEFGPSLDEIVNMPKDTLPYPSEEYMLNMPANKRLHKLKTIKFKGESQKSHSPVCKYCNNNQPSKYVLNQMRGVDCIDARFGEKVSKEIYPEYVFRLFKKITDKNCYILGFDPITAHPSSLILHAIPVCPPICRPYIDQGNGLVSQDHITIRYQDILKSNELVKNTFTSSVKAREKGREFLAHDVATLFDNETGNGFIPKGSKSQIHQTFAQRIKGKIPKLGRIRANLMSSRVEMSARSVITPDPMIDLDEIGIPIYIAKKLTFPEKVTNRNISFLVKCFENGDTYPGSVGVIPQGSNRIMKDKNYLVKVGDIVVRHLCDGDYVLMNRAPTLHKKSMMGHRVKIFKGYSFRLNVNVTEPYNADFDGDEMNLHCPQSVYSSTELSSLAGLNNQCMSAASSEPAIPFVQDNVLAAHMMTTNNDKITSKKDFMNIIARGAPYYYGYSSKDSLKGVDILKYFSPEFLNINLENMNKNTLKKIVKETYHEYGEKACFYTISTLQKLFGEYFSANLYSIGPKDLIREGGEVETEVDELLTKMIHQLSTRLSQIHKGKVSPDGDLFESFVNKLNSDLDNKCEKLLGSKERSRFKPMIESGSKGKKKNIKQMKGFLGQQIVNGRRTNSGYTDRTLPHFHKYSENIETRGFIKSSFSKGLHPHEFFFHAGGGREGLIEQALQTGQTGYIQRELIKTLEDLTVKWSNVVSDAQGNIVQFLYGEDGFTGEKMENHSINVANDGRSLEMTHSLTVNKKDWMNCVLTKSIQEDENMFKVYYNTLVSLRRRLSRAAGGDGARFPINLKRKLTILVNKFSLSKKVKTDLDPLTILMSYHGLIDRCQINKCNHGTQLLEYMLYAFAGPKELICKYRVTKKAFSYFVKNIEESFKFSKIEPGESVGILAAQSLGEPCTQLTLNSFHFAGAGRSQGLPRIQELLNMENKPMLAVSEIYLQPPHCFVESDANNICDEINCHRLKDVIVSYKLYFTGIDGPEIRNYMNLEKLTNATGYMSSPWILKLFLDVENVRITDTWTCLNNLPFVHNPILESEEKTITFRISVYNVKDATKKNGQNLIDESGDFYVNDIKQIVEKGLEPIIIKGISPLRDAFVEETIYNRYDEILDTNVPQKIFKIIASGTNLEEILCNPAIDPYLTNSNNIIDAYNIFGIEAARTVFIKELHSVLKEVAPLDVRHVSVLVDRLVQNGTLSQANSTGMDDFENGPLAKASFEKVLYHLHSSSLTGSIDTLDGISSNIMVGQVAPCGTGTVDVSIDEKAKLYMVRNESPGVGRARRRDRRGASRAPMIHFDID